MPLQTEATEPVEIVAVVLVAIVLLALLVVVRRRPKHDETARALSAPSVEDEPSTRTTAELLGSRDIPALAELQWRLSTPIAAILLTILAVPLAKANPRQGRYSKLLVAVLAYVFYVNLLGAARVWLEQGRTPPVFGLWWVHVLVLALALLVLFVQNNMLGLRAVRVTATP